MLLRLCSRRLGSGLPNSLALRATILPPVMTSNASNPTRSFASPASSTPLAEQPGDEPNDVLFGSSFGLRTITLNRPKKLNSLNGSMARKIIPRLQEWSKSQLANVIVIKGEGRAFCAGGDVAFLAQRNKAGAAGQQESKDYFALEYTLDHLIATYNTPYVAFIDGITMGGGVGLSVHAPFRIATENTVFAMPETTIGFFPDVGASFFLPRLDGELGMYLALTSAQLRGVQTFYAGIATHYLHSSSLPDLETRLAELQFKDYDPLPHRLRIINSTIEEFCTGLPVPDPSSPINDTSPSASVVGGDLRAAIDYVFQPANDLAAALASLQGLSENPDGTTPVAITTWAAQTHATILSRSPTSAHVTFRLLREGARWGIAQAFRREHVLASAFMEREDFVEGVSALLIDKPKRTPQWTPARIEDVKKADVDALFKGKMELDLLGSKGAEPDYKDYPHAWAGLPREREVAAKVAEARTGSMTKAGLVEEFVEEWGGKMGVKEKVEEVLQRKVTEVEGGLAWVR